VVAGAQAIRWWICEPLPGSRARDGSHVSQAAENPAKQAFAPMSLPACRTATLLKRALFKQASSHPIGTVLQGQNWCVRQPET
jgi:hypothetical protein